MIRTVDSEEAQALQARGATLVRHAHDMVLDLDTAVIDPGWQVPNLPSRLRLTHLDEALIERIALASLEAYPPEHPDHTPGYIPQLPDAMARYAGLANGSRAGELIADASGALVDESTGRVVASAVITNLPADSAWPGGPWVADVFTIPAWSGLGLGRTLLRRAIATCRALSHQRLGLTVTEGNPARHLYERLGFTTYRSLFVLDSHS